MNFRGMSPLFLLLTAAGLFAAPFPGEVRIPDGFGVNIHFTDPKPGEMEMLAASGVKWVRMDFVWSAIERQKGVYDFSAYDRLVAALEKHDLRALFILDYGNRLYDGGASPASAEARQAFAKWAAAGVARFKGRGFVWEMWNEPNIGFWKPEPNVTNYIALARETGRAIREAAPGEWYVGPATSRIDLPFLEACFKAGLLEYWDAVTVHPYRHTSGPETVGPEYGRLRDLIAAHAPKGRRIPIVSGEWGFSAAWSGFDEDSQGAMLARQWLVNAFHGIPLSIWYDWHDDGKDPKEAEHHFGTVAHAYHAGRNPVYDPKPAYRAARTFNTVLAGFKSLRRVPLSRAPDTGGPAGANTASHPEDWALLFDRDGDRVLAAWTTAREPVRVRLPVADGAIQATTHLGEAAAPLTASNGVLALTLSGNPLYVRLKKNDEPGQPGPKGAGPAFDWGDERLSALVPCPAPGRRLAVCVKKEFGPALEGRVAARVGGRIVAEQTVSLPAGPANLVERFDAGVDATDAGPIALSFARRDGAVIYQSVPRRLVPLDLLVSADAPARIKAHRSGDGQAQADVNASWETPPAGLPLPAERALRIDFKSEKGFRYFRLAVERDADRAIAGRPAALGLWACRRGSNASLSVRMADSSGEIYQPPHRRLEDDGWRYVEIPLDGATASHWGGDNDGAMDGALRWDSILILDRDHGSASEGSVWIAHPVLIYEPKEKGD